MKNQRTQASSKFRNHKIDVIALTSGGSTTYVNTSYYASPSLMENWTTLQATWQYFRLRRVKFYFIPKSPYTITGYVGMGFQDSNEPAPTLGLDQTLNLINARNASVSKGCSVSYKVPDHELQWVDTDHVNDEDSQENLKKLVIAFEEVPASTALGELYMEIDVDFKDIKHDA